MQSHIFYTAWMDHPHSNSNVPKCKTHM